MSKRNIAVSSSRIPIRRAPLALLLATTALTSPLLIGAAFAQTLPTGGSVAAGSATIVQPNATTLTITQSSPSAVVNWQGFSVGQGSAVTFAQPNASSTILNRVTSSAPSTIAGSITANGQVYLVNPNGIAITPTGTVNTGGGFVASTLGISDSDFMSGKRTFTGNGASAGVSNAGTISVGRGGYAALIGGTVSNAGSIDVPLGKVGLGSGERATLDFAGDGFLQVAMPTHAGGKSALIRNSGSIKADGGSVIISAATAREAARNAINMSGVIQANTISGHNGAITIGGGDGGAVKLKGRLDTSSSSGQGGRIAVTGRDIKVKGASVDASGKTGGGAVNIGGGRQGTGPLQRADTVSIDSTTKIKADARETGNGGNVVVWSDNLTSFAGTISAKGGALSGNGGEAEVSGKAKLAYTGFADLSAIHGAFGTLLLDPYNVTISTGANANQSGFAAIGNDSIINAATLIAALGSANVTVSTGSSGTQAGNIAVAAPLSWASPTTLTLNAANAIAVNAPINVTGAGGVSLIYNTMSPTNLLFGGGASIDYGAINNGGTLSVNAQSYALVYSMAGLAGMSTNGQTALATNLFATLDGTANGTPTTYTGSVVGTLTGTFEGLGHTISHLTIASTTNNANVGLFGKVSGGTVRDIGLVGGTVTGTDNSTSGNVGALVGLLTTVGGGTAASVVNAFASTIVSGGVRATAGGLVGQALTSGAPTLIANSRATGTVSAGPYGNAGGLVGLNNANASAATITGSYATGTVSTGNAGMAGGLTAYNFAYTDNATITASYATGNVTGGTSATLGGLVGQNYSRSGNTASISNAYATGTVGSSGVTAAGGLAGTNQTSSGYALISNAYATGAVFGGSQTGGLVGGNTSIGSGSAVASITNAYATGAVSGVQYGQTGGLVGMLQANGSNVSSTVANAYSTGRVTGVSAFVTYIGGSIGWAYRASGGTISVSNVSWDNVTSGQAGPTGIGNDSAGQQGNVTGLTTRQLQGLDPLSGSTYFSTAAQLGDGTTSHFAGGANGLYPYLTSLFSGGVEVVSGTVYADGGTLPLASGQSGAVTVNVLAGGTRFASATTGANGYYYAFSGAAMTANQNVLVYTNANAVTGATDAATLTVATGVTALGGVNLYGNTLTAPTSALTLSTTPDIAAAANAAAGGISPALAAIGGTIGRYYIATGSGFTIDQAITTSNVFGVQTSAPGAGITVARPITINSGGSLGLLASGALAINAPVTVKGVGSVRLDAGTDTTTVAGASLLKLSFGNGAGLTFANADGTAATSSQGGTLAIHGQTYTLLYNLADPTSMSQGPDSSLDGIAGIDSNAAAGGSAGLYALATNLTGTGTAANPQFIRPLVGTLGSPFSGVFDGLGHTITNLTMAQTSNYDLALFEQNAGTIRNIGLVGGSVSNANGRTAPLVAWNITKGIVANAYSSMAVNGDGDTGGLVGRSQAYDPTDVVAIVNSYATGTVTGSGSYTNVGGLVGKVDVSSGASTVVNSYATGAVSNGGQNGFAGGLVGVLDGGGSIQTSYATGAVSGTNGATLGGLIGLSQGSATVSQSFWDTQTSGLGVGAGIGNDMGSTSDVTGLTTTQFQSSGASSLGAAFAGGANGLYPYLKSFYPNGVQAISGIAYRNGATGVLASGPGGAGLVTVIGNGAALNTVSTGANGYYYVVAPAGTLAASNAVLAYTVAVPSSGATNAATLTSSAGAATQAGVNIYGGTLTGMVSDITLSAASSSIVSSANAAANGDSNALGAISGAVGRNFIATGAGFTIDQTVSTNGVFGVRTTATNAPITVAQAITVNTSDSLWLQAAGALAINAPVSVTGAGSVALAASYDTTTVSGTSLLNLSFATGVSIDYGATNHGGTLSVNGQSYGLLYNMGDVASVNSNLADNYAVATNIDASGTTYTTGVISRSTGSFRPTPFAGTFEGLGHTISNLTINAPLNFAVGLIGYLTGTVRDIGVVGGSITARTSVGGLVGYSEGSVTNAYATGAVSGEYYIGGLVGSSDGSVTNSYATGTVSGGYNSSSLGGLIGSSGGTVTNAYATGAVSGGNSSFSLGGLVGTNGLRAITNTYSTGAVSGGNGSSNIGGLVGYSSGGAVTNSYWDIQTSGQSVSVGGTGLTTRQLQGLDPISGSTFFSTVTNLGNGMTSAFAGGASGFYPYLSSFFPNGVQVISGTAYTDAGLTAASPRTVGVIGYGALFATASAGANGYYYAFGANGTIAGNATLLVNNGVNAATLTTTNGAIIQSVNLYGNALTIPTTATSLSTAPSLSAARTTALAATGGNADAQAAINNATSRGFFASGAAGFTIDQNLAIGSASTFYTQTVAANAPITVTNGITINGNGSLALLASGALTINEPITVGGAGSVNLAYDPSSPTNLSFGAPLDYGATDNGGRLVIGGNAYTLLYDMAAVANVNTNLAGNYAIATNLDASGTTYTTGVIAGGVSIGSFPTAFSGIFEGLGHTIANLTISAGREFVGLIGTSTGTVRDLGLNGGSVRGVGYTGGLVGWNDGSIVHAYTTSVVSGSYSTGGLVGTNRGTIAQVYATGAVSGPGGERIGGLVGNNLGSITNTYATGAVDGGSYVGGLVGYNYGSVSNAYAMGAVNGYTLVGGLVGTSVGGSVANGYFDSQTTGRSTSAGGTGLTTRQLQGLDPISGSTSFSTVTHLGDGITSAFAGGANGLYPYLSRFFLNGVQVISGTAYKDVVNTPLASIPDGPVTVNIIGGGTPFGSATTGANGYYYVFGRPGSIAANATLLATINANANGANNSTTLTTASGTSVNGNSNIETGVNLYNGALAASTGEITLTAADSVAVAAATTAANGNTAALSAIASATGRYYTATGASFTIDQSVTTSNVFSMRTSPGAALTVGNAITLNDGGSLGLLSGGTLAINAPLSVKGAGSVALAFDASSPGNLSFNLLGNGFGGGLTFAKSDGSTASSSQGGTLAINGQSYALLYNLGSVGASDAIQDIDTIGLSGRYALATNLNGAGTTFSAALAGANFSNLSNTGAFAGTFDGLGHTISNLTIASTTDHANVGLFGVSSGTIRNVGIVLGSATGTGNFQTLGLLAAKSYGNNANAMIANAFATGTVSNLNGSGDVGGLVASNYFAGSGSATILGSFASVAVSAGPGVNVGGLVGGSSGVIADSYATGPATITAAGTVGGLVGQQSGGSITNAYATGAVIGGNASTAGGLIGSQSIYNDAVTVSDVYATGAVAAGTAPSTYVGGLIGRSHVFGSGSIALSNASWDKTTSGRANGIGYDQVGQSGNITGLTTAQFQTATAAANLGSAFAGGAGFYPYLTRFAPNGVQAFTGTASSDAGTSALASGTTGAVTIALNADGTRIGQATTGANGYYYIATPLGAPFTPVVNNGQNLLAFTLRAPKQAATSTMASGGQLQIGLNLYGNALTVDTAATLFSQGPRTATEARSVNATVLALVAGSDAAATAAINGAVGLGLLPTGGSFTIDQTPTINGVLAIAGCCTSSVTVNASITVDSGHSLGLLSGGTLAINAPIAVNGAGSVALAYDAASPTNLTFALGKGLTYTGTNGQATSSSAGGALTINGQGYTLLYSVADIDAIDGRDAIGRTSVTTPTGPGGSGLAGRYALAGNFDASGATYTDSLISVSASPSGFGGTLEGLGHTISGLTINSSNYAIGLIGATGSGAVVRDIGLSGGSFTGLSTAGTLVGSNRGVIANAFSTAAVSATTAGGLAGSNETTGTIVNVWTAGSVIAPGLTMGGTGGIAGINDSAITDAASASYVRGFGYVGGIVGSNSGTGSVSNVLATGAVAGVPSQIGGLIGVAAFSSSPIVNGYWDTQTSGQLTSTRGGTGLTTAQLQTATAGSNLGSAFAGGAGLYPNLKSFFPNGVQAVAGFAYQDAGATPLGSGWSSAGSVSMAANGQSLGTVTTGANGYYYAIVPAGTLGSTGVAAFTQNDMTSGAKNAVSYASGTPGVVTTLNISGGWRRDNAGSTIAMLSALQNGFASTTSGTPVAGFTLPNRQINTTAAFDIDQVLAVTGTLALNATGTVTQSAAIAASKLWLSGVSSAFTLTNSNNAIDTLVANTGSVNVNSMNALTISAGITDAMSSTISGITTAGTASIASAGNLTLTNGASVSGANPVLAAAGAFINNAGANAVMATTGRWLVYSADTATDVFGGLNSGNTAVWNTPSGTALNLAGHRYVFAANRILTVTTSSDSKTYGDDATASVATRWSISGFDAGLSGVYLADTATTAFTGMANVTSNGSAVTAHAASPYAITASLGSLISNVGYGFNVVNAGTLAVNRRAITVTADAQSRVYGDADPALTYTVGGRGLINGDTLSGGLLMMANAISSVGSYAIMQGLLAASSNYAVSYVGANLAVNRRAITVTADAQSRTYGEANPALTYTVGGRGLVDGDTLSGSLFSAANGTSSIGNYAITQGSLAASSNYAMTYVGGLLTVRPAIASDAALLASSITRDRLDGIALPVGATPLPGISPVATTLGLGTFYSDPRFNGVLVCFAGGGGAAATCFAVSG